MDVTLLNIVVLLMTKTVHIVYAFQIFFIHMYRVSLPLFVYRPLHQKKYKIGIIYFILPVLFQSDDV